ncbi:MAG: class II aldolase/adducin family protein [Ignavibacteria bacterium]|nr:class II aldolase/adducin family protein [Ignavibacteria bacterium]
MNEGYIKFQYKIVDGAYPKYDEVAELIKLRTHFFDLGLIGYDGKVSFGNISKRINETEFIISASNTGLQRVLSPEDFVIVFSVELNKNFVLCKGKFPPSSEALTHFSIYRTFEFANYAVHFHNYSIWKRLKNVLPTTNKNYSYGSIELANSISQLKWQISGTKGVGVIVLGGHESGLFIFGKEDKLILEEINKLISG